jgi:hypothetical protein
LYSHAVEERVRRGLQAMGMTLTPTLSLARARELGKLHDPVEDEHTGS